MARLRQLHAQRYDSRTTIHDEFENVIRYLTAAELGNISLPELVAKLFDRDGNFDGPIEFRFDSVEGIQVRIGEFEDNLTGWQTIGPLSSLRGPAGLDVGTVDAPLLRERVDIETTAVQSVFDYAHTAQDTLMVFIDGILQRPTLHYTNDPAGGVGGTGTVTFVTAVVAGKRVTILKATSTLQDGIDRIDYVVPGPNPETIFSVASLDTSTVILVFQNGFLQLPGATNDYILNTATNQVIMNSPVPATDIMTFVGLHETSTQTALGLMTEARYTDPTSGNILFAKLQIPTGAITTDKVANLDTRLADQTRISIGTATPDVTQFALWVDTTQTSPRLRFSDGLVWHNSVLDVKLPQIGTADAGKHVRVDNLAGGYILENIDFSGLLSSTTRGAANGVADLDANARLPRARLPIELSRDSWTREVPGSPIPAEDYLVQFVYGQTVQLTHLFAEIQSGSATVQVSVDKAPVGSSYPVTAAAPVQVPLSGIQIDSIAAAKRIGLIVTPTTAPIGIACSIGVLVFST